MGSQIGHMTNLKKMVIFPSDPLPAAALSAAKMSDDDNNCNDVGKNDDGDSGQQ